MALHRVWVDARTMIALEDSVMTWMKAGEFECENGCKAVVLGRVPDPNDTPKYPWTGYVEIVRDPQDAGKRWMKMAWTDEGKTDCWKGYNIKPPVQVRYTAVTPEGRSSSWQHSLQHAVSAVLETAFVIAVEFIHVTIVNPQNIRVFLPNGQNTWKQMGLRDLRVTTILAPNGSWTCEQKV